MALLFPRNVNGFPMTRERLGVVVVSMRSGDPGPDCPQYPGWNGGSTEPGLRGGRGRNGCAWKSWQRICEAHLGTDQGHSTF